MGDTFDVLVGKGPLQKCFTLHTDFFIPRSEFFRAARSAAWNKGGDSKIPTSLEDDDLEVFGHYKHCIYVGNVNFLPHHSELGDTEGSEHFESLIELYIMGDKLGDIITANMVIDRIMSVSDEVEKLPRGGDLELAYNSTVSGSPLRALFRDYFIHEVTVSYLGTDKLTDCPRELLEDIVLGYLEIKRKNASKTINAALAVEVSTMTRCHYHQHDSSVPGCTPSQSTPVAVVPIT